MPGVRRGKTEAQDRLLPACVVVSYIIAMALYAQASYEKVMRHLVEGLSAMGRLLPPPTAGADIRTGQQSERHRRDGTA